MEIRPARLADAPAIATIHVQAWQHAYRGIVSDTYLQAMSIEAKTTDWQRHLGGPAALRVAMAGDTMLGWISFGPCRDDDIKTASPSAGELWALYVAPASWRAGVGRALCLAAFDHMQRSAMNPITLWVLSANTPARLFYERVGFQLEAGSEKRFELGGAAVDEVRYRFPSASARASP